MKPHVIVIMADQLRADVLGKGLTPNIDSIAEEGARFNRAYCSCPLCVPSRGSLFTGTYPNTNGSLINPWEPADAACGDVKMGIANLYELLEDDWEGIHSGKQHLFTEGGKLEDRPDSKIRWLTTEKTYAAYLKENGKKAPGGPGFRMRVPEMVGGKITRVSNYSNANTGCYEEGEAFYFDRYFADKALEGLRDREGKKPLFLSAMFLAPHPPLHIPQPWYGLLAPEKVRLPENVGVFYPNQSPLQMYNLTGVVGAAYGRQEWKEAWRVYLGLVAMLDACVGQILDELKAQGIYEESLIVFTSDHGEMLGSHGLFQKMCMYEESARTPLYIKFPKGFPLSKQVFEKTVGQVDLLPTFCDYLGLHPENAMDGRSLMPLLEGREEDAGGEAFIQYDGNGSCSNFQRCIVKDGWKLIVDMFKDEAFFELYDLENDPQETENRMFSGDQDARALKLWEILGSYIRRTGDRLRLPALDPEAFRRAYAAFPCQ